MDDDWRKNRSAGDVRTSVTPCEVAFKGVILGVSQALARLGWPFPPLVVG
jgi:hypothetical protein